MDEVNITTKFSTVILSKIFKNLIRKKTGYFTNPSLNSFKMSVDSEQTHIHLDMDIDIENGEFLRFLTSCGI